MKTKKVKKIESTLTKIVNDFEVQDSISRTVQYQLKDKLSEVFADIYWLIEKEKI